MRVEVKTIQEVGLEERLCIWVELLDKLLHVCHLLGTGKILLSQSLEEDLHVGARDVVITLKLLPLFRLEDSSCIE